MVCSKITRIRNCWLLLSITGSVLPACQSKHEVERPETVAAVVAPAPTAASEAQTLAQRLGPIIGGGWLSADYLRELSKTRSPSTAAAHISADIPVSLFIAPAAGLADSTKADLNYNMHEGEEASIFFRTGHAKGALPFRSRIAGETDNYCEVSFQYSSTDTTLYLSKYTTRGKLIWRTAYTKTLGANAKLVGNEWPMHQTVNYALNKLLAAGKYSGADSLGHLINVYFAPNGLVTGLPFRKYHILEDFIGPSSGDEIIFDMYAKNQVSMAASFHPDTLRLYSIIPVNKAGSDTLTSDTDTVVVAREVKTKKGRLRYQLVRKR